MFTRPLALQEQAAHSGMTHVTVVTADDLTVTAANTAQSLSITLATGDIMGAVEDSVVVNFQDASDTAFNATTRSLGDNSAVTTHTAAAETNANGTVVPKKFSNTAVGPYTAANTLKITFNAMAAKSLVDIDKGELHVYFRLLRISDLDGAQNATLITTK